MKSKFKKAFRIFIWGVVALVVAVAGLYLAIVQPGGSGELASLRLSDGSEYRVTQRCNWGAEPYTVSFYMRSPEGEWGWCYIDHEATRWRDVTMTYDTDANTIEVTEQGIRRAALDRNRSVFWIDNGSGIKRELDAPQATVLQPEFASR